MNKKIKIVLCTVLVVILAAALFVGCSPVKTPNKGYASLDAVGAEFYIAGLDNGKVNVIGEKGKKLLKSDYDNLTPLSDDGKILFATTAGVEGGEVVSLYTGAMVHDFKNMSIKASDIRVEIIANDSVKLDAKNLEINRSAIYLMTYVDNNVLHGYRIDDSKSVNTVFAFDLAPSVLSYNLQAYTKTHESYNPISKEMVSSGSFIYVTVSYKSEVNNVQKSNLCVLDNGLNIIETFVGDSIITENFDVEYEYSEFGKEEKFVYEYLSILTLNGQENKKVGLFDIKRFTDVTNIKNIENVGLVVETTTGEGVTTYSLFNPKDNVVVNLDSMIDSKITAEGYLSGNSALTTKEAMYARNNDTFIFYDTKGNELFQTKVYATLSGNLIHDITNKALYDIVTYKKILEYTDTFETIVGGENYTMASVDNSKYVVLDNNTIIGSFEGNDWGTFSYNSVNKMFTSTDRSIMLEGKQKGQILNAEELTAISGYVVRVATVDSEGNNLSQNELEIMKYKDTVNISGDFIRIGSITENRMDGIDIVYTEGEISPKTKMKSYIFNNGLIEVYSGNSRYSVTENATQLGVVEYIYNNGDMSFSVSDTVDIVSNIVIVTTKADGTRIVEVKKTAMQDITFLSSDYYAVIKNRKIAILNKELKLLTPYMFTYAKMEEGTDYALVGIDNASGIIKLTKKGYKIIQNFADRANDIEVVGVANGDLYYTMSKIDKNGNQTVSLYRNDKAEIKDAVWIKKPMNFAIDAKKTKQIGTYRKADGKTYEYCIEFNTKKTLLDSLK